VFVEHSQDNAPMALAAARFDEACATAGSSARRRRECSTPGCRCGGLRGHVLNAVEPSRSAARSGSTTALRRQGRVPEHGLEALLRPLDNVAVDIGGNQALIGVVQTAERGVLTLTATEVHEGGQTTKITGLYHVPLEQVEGIQVKQSATPLRAVPEPAEVESA
jgi:hypothetical protein